MSWSLFILTTLHVLEVFLLYFCSPQISTQIHVLDVGQGDATLISTSSGRQILIDAGPDQNILAPLSKVLPPFARTLDLLILTHPHADHIDGALALLKWYQVRALLITNVNYNNGNFNRLIAEAYNQGILLFFAQADTDWLIDQQLLINILFPFSELTNRSFKNVNNSSIVFMLQTPAAKCLFTGDMEKELESVVVKYYNDFLSAQYLKVGHHGSKTSSSLAFLQQVQPQEMWVSVGKNNRYHHPDEDTMKRLRSFGSVFRTDQVGTIEKILVQ